MKRWRRFKAALLLVAACGLCNAWAQASEPGKAEIPASVPGADGTPLPPPNKAVGDKWPPEVKRFIDGMLLLFGKGERPSLSTQEIESTLGVTLVPESLIRYQVDVSYAVSGSELLSPFSVRQRLSGYRIGMLRKDGRRFHTLDFSIDPQRYCVSPYDFAVYTGNRYSPEIPVHGFRSPDRAWPLAYEWGMFNRTSSMRYWTDQKPGVSLLTSNTCILVFRAHTFTTEETHP